MPTVKAESNLVDDTGGLGDVVPMQVDDDDASEIVFLWPAEIRIRDSMITRQ